jgi:hypothetical protein
MYEKYEEVVPRLRLFETIVVTGPQRSGTTITSKMIAHDLQREYIDEDHFATHRFDRFLEYLHPNAVIQAPGLSAYCHLLSVEVAVVFMFRDIQEIIESQSKLIFGNGLTWTEHEQQRELSKYFLEGGAVPHVKYAMWEKFQKPAMNREGKSYFQLRYRSLAGHALWISDDRRKNFGPRQTTL